MCIKGIVASQSRMYQLNFRQNARPKRPDERVVFDKSL